MVQLTITETNFKIEKTYPLISGIVPLPRARKFAALAPWRSFLIFDVVSKQIYEMTEARDPDATTDSYPRVIWYREVNRNRAIVWCAHGISGKVRIRSYDLDFVEKKAYVEVISESSDNNAVPWGPQYSGSVGRYTFLWVPVHTVGYVNVIDVLTGEKIRTKDFGFGSYNPRLCGSRVIVNPDDVYILLGRHYAGDPYRVWKFYSDAVETIDTIDGNSPNPGCGFHYIDSRYEIIVASGGNVHNADGPWLILDRKLAKLNKVSIASQLGWSYAVTYCWVALGRTKNDRIVGFAFVNNNHLEVATAAKFVKFEIDPSNWSVSITPLQDLDAVYYGPGGTYSVKTHVPMVDTRNNKIHIVAVKFPFGNISDWQFVFIEIDYSDIADDIVEYNLNLADMYTGRIPTTLTLEVRIT